MGKTAVISGAGPVGALTAILLAKQGYDVKVFEKRGLPERVPARTDRKAYLLNLNGRAMHAFKLADVDLGPLIGPHNGAVETIFRRANGTVRHKYLAEVTSKNPSMLRVYRDEIARHLIDEAKRLFPEAISFTFNAALASVDFNKQIAQFAPQGKSSLEVHYDLLVGADGAASVVRDQLQHVLPPGFIRRLSHNVVYATGPLSKAKEGDFPGHTFMDVHPIQYGSIMVYSRGDGDQRVGLFVDKTGADQVRSGDAKELAKQVDSLERLPGSAKAAVRELISAKPDFQKMSGWTYLTQLHGPRTLLVGDAAHTMTPVLGQGCNSGLEDAGLFSEILAKKGGDLETALPAFTAARLPDITALIELNEIAADERMGVPSNSREVLHRLFVNGHSVLMTMHLTLHTFLNKALPGVFDRPAMIRAQLGALKFREVRPAMYWDLAVVSGIVIAVGASIASYYRSRS